MSADWLRTEIIDSVATVTLDRSESMNALGRTGDGDAFGNLIASLAARTDVRCLILTGAGTAFCAGGDLKAMTERTGMFAGDGPTIRNAYREGAQRITRALYCCELPVIAAVNGPAIGLGCDLACMADLRIASDRARFGVTFLQLGLVPGDGGAWLLPRLIGRAAATRLLFTAEVLEAQSALAIGLVDEVVPHESLLDAAHTLAARIVQQPREALRMTKLLLRSCESGSLDQALELAASFQALLHLGPDHAAGLAALRAKLGR
jgi:enoyl-CoA hydratase/carnithine racemase